MIQEEKNNRVHLYLDSKLNKFSNVSFGLILRALGENYNVAYINSNFDGLGFFKDFNIDFFSYENFYLNKKYDLIVFDNCDLKKLSYQQIREICEDKENLGEIVLTFSNKDDFEKIVELSDLVSEFEMIKNDIENDKIINITGNGKGKSTWCFGEIFRNFIENKKIKLIYFDKGGNFYSERFLFDKIELEYFVSGCVRFDGKKFRFENNPEDFTQAKKGLDELEKSLNQYDLIIAEELNTTIKVGLLENEEVLKILNKNIDSKLIISGRYANEDILKISNKQIFVNEIKHYSRLGFKVKKGIDF